MNFADKALEIYPFRTLRTNELAAKEIRSAIEKALREAHEAGQRSVLDRMALAYPVSPDRHGSVR